MNAPEDRVVSDLPRVAARPDQIAAIVSARGAAQVAAPPTEARGFVELLRSLGELMFTDGETPAAEAPELNVVTNVGRTRAPRSVFHADTTYVPQPPSFSALFAIDAPEQGGATLFTDQYAAAEESPPALRRTLIGAHILHGRTDASDAGAVWHPVLRAHPVTGRTALFLTSEPRCLRLVLADGTDRSDLIPALYARSIERAPPLRHVWRAGDVIVWDNRCTLHAADHSGVVGRRTLYRGLVRGERPRAAVA